MQYSITFCSILVLANDIISGVAIEGVGPVDPRQSSFVRLGALVEAAPYFFHWAYQRLSSSYIFCFNHNGSMCLVWSGHHSHVHHLGIIRPIDQVVRPLMHIIAIALSVSLLRCVLWLDGAR